MRSAEKSDTSLQDLLTTVQNSLSVIENHFHQSGVSDDEKNIIRDRLIELCQRQATEKEFFQNAATILRNCVEGWKMVRGKIREGSELPRAIFVSAFINALNNILKYQWRINKPDIETSEIGRLIRNAIRQSIRRLSEHDKNGLVSKKLAGYRLQRYFNQRRTPESVS